MADKEDKEKKAKEGGDAKKERQDKAAAKAASGAPQQPEGKKEAKGGGEKKEAKGGEKKDKGGKDKGGKKEGGPTPVYKRTAPPRLKTMYKDVVIARMMEEFKYSNVNQVPRVQKVSVNMGLGEAVSNPKILDSAVEELRAITGQAPVVTKSKKAIANFKLRAGLKIGAMVTLRRERMWEFLDRLMNLALPRVRDFKGVSPKAFDGRGNFSLGIREQIIFPEINYDKIDKIKGLNVSIVTTARTDDEGRALLRHLGMPFRQ
jgi:large subunit ribosomal protein L5